MTVQQRSYAVLRDDQDNYYAIPREAFDSHRVRREWKAKLRRALDGEDVEGFVHTLPGEPKILPDLYAGSSNLQFLGVVTVDDPELLEALSLALPE
jgi:hypothetical protein